jgi:charged multivesicular body protein 7
MKSYDSSAVTLRTILAHPSLQRDSIDKMMDALAEANVDAREVDDAVRMSGDVALGTDGIVDDDELEAEWKALVEEAETAQRLKDVQATTIGEGLRVPQEHPSVADPISVEPLRTPVVVS